MHVHAISRPEFELFDNFHKEAIDLPDIMAKEIEEGTVRAAWTLVDGFVMDHSRIFVSSSSVLSPQLLETMHGAGHEGV
jgi:hypothetical protein